MDKRAQFARQCRENGSVRDKRSRQHDCGATRLLNLEQVTTASGTGQFNDGIACRASQRCDAARTRSVMYFPQLRDEASEIRDPHLGCIAPTETLGSRLNLDSDPTVLINTPNPPQLKLQAVRCEPDG